MCYFSNTDKPLKLKEDLIVYKRGYLSNEGKWFNPYYQSWFTYFSGNMASTAEFRIVEQDLDNMNSSVNLQAHGNTYAIFTGYHAYLDAQIWRDENPIEANRSKYTCHYSKAVEYGWGIFLIPKGSLYFKNVKFNLTVSNKITFLGALSEENDKIAKDSVNKLSWKEIKF